MLPMLILFSGAAQAVPAQFTHQGRLLGTDGTPLEGTTTLTFRVTNADAGGDILWEEAITVTLNSGFYSAVLGADEDGNPLDAEVFGQAPVWLELQVDGEEAMTPRSPVNAVPYATLATIAEELSGGPVDASEIAVGGTPIVNEAGEWVGPPSTISWTEIEGIPPGFADGIDDDIDTDTLATLGLSCLDGDIPVWDGVVGSWGCGVDAVLTPEEVDDIVADNGFAMADDLFSGSFLDLSDVPAGLSDGDDNTQLSEDEVDEMVADNGYLTSADLVGVGGSGTVIYTRCAWTGAIMPDIGTCTPPSCPEPWDDLGITGNVKTGLAAHASTDYSPPYSESSGYQERACYLANPKTVLTTRCAWTGAIAPDIETCTPPECPDAWTDLGVTGNIKSAVGMYGSTDYSPPYSEASGYQERTCVR